MNSTNMDPFVEQEIKRFNAKHHIVTKPIARLRLIPVLVFRVSKKRCKATRSVPLSSFRTLQSNKHLHRSLE